jgi:RNA polymerase sigma-70 factor (ECF subfamily)
MTHAERERQFLELFEQNKASIRRVCFGYLNSTSEVEDLFQEIMTNVWHSLPSFRGEAKISTWVYRIAVNTALVYRKKWKHGEELPEIVDARPCAHQTLEEQERLGMLHAAIATLPDQERVIITLLLEGLSYREIADVTGITVNYVGVKISRIKDVLEQLIGEASNGRV